MKNFCFYAILLLGAFTFQGCGDDNEIPDIDDEKEEDKINWDEAADAATGSLTDLFWNSRAYYFNYDSNGKPDFHYWPQAHGLDVWIDAYLRTGDSAYKNYFEQWFEGVKIKNGNTFRNDYYDDMEWIALALLRAYQATRDTRYKDATLQIWEYIQQGWNNQAGGGIAWVTSQPWSKNACSNGPACILAARLYQEFGDEANKEWAIRIYNWQKNTLVNSNGAVYDNINGQNGEIQRNWIFTYNQGTFAGSAIELYRILGEKSYLNDAVLVANYTINTLVENSVLKSEGEGDGGLFKGIFIRYFTNLIRQKDLETSDRQRYIKFIKYNAETLWNEGTNQPSVLFGTNWRQKPGYTTGLTEQLSGCMLIESMALLEKEGYFD